MYTSSEVNFEKRVLDASRQRNSKRLTVDLRIGSSYFENQLCCAFQKSGIKIERRKSKVPSELQEISFIIVDLKTSICE